MKKPRCIYLLIAMLCYKFAVFGQVKAGLNSFIYNLNAGNAKLPIEKLYLQTDKPYYTQDDTLWFKTYLFNADYLTAATRSNLLYVELDDENNTCVKRILLPLISGLTWGNIALDKETIPEGSYTLRAYTNWMRNFGEDYIFKKQIYIASAGEQSRLVTAAFTQRSIDGKNNVRANILISNIDGDPVRLRTMQLKVMNGSHELMRSNITTEMDGKMDVNFNLPTNLTARPLSIIARDITKNAQAAPGLNIPVIIKRPENTDLQFMPEGGKLVAGITSVIGFKAIAEDGEGEDVSGEIYDSKGSKVSTFSSLHNGMGTFRLVPIAAESYIAKINTPRGVIKTYPLPAIQLSGTVLSIKDSTDSLKIKISAVSDLALLVKSTPYYLIGQSRGVVCYAAGLNSKRTTVTLSAAKSMFPTGIIHFTLFSADGRPLNERLCFVNHHDNFKIDIAANKSVYLPRDSVQLKIKVSDAAGKPVRGSFSLAVTDNNQVKPDSNSNNIVNDLLLTSDLKGTVEQPEYYFESSGDDSIDALDDLMLTQGWVGYDWKKLSASNTQPDYAAESEYVISGAVTNIFNKPVANTGVVLLSTKPSFATDTLTDKHGRFVFKGFSPVDTAAFVIEAKNKHGKSFNVQILVDEFKPPIFTQTPGRSMPWYVNSDTALLRNLNDKKLKHEAEIKLSGANVLNEVTIKAKKTVKGSHNLNSDGGADETLDEQDMEKAGKMTLLDILNKKVKGFIDVGHNFLLDQQNIVLIIDGVNVNRFFVPDGQMADYIMARYRFLKTTMDYITAEDIVGIEAMYNLSKTVNYDITYYPEIYYRYGPTGFSYIEITTRSGHGAYMKTTPGVYEYKPLAFSLPKQFYRPKYTIKNKSLLPDLRSTIHWEPNILTDTNGNATVSFYTADKPSRYTIIIEGSDMNGQLGFARSKIVVH